MSMLKNGGWRGLGERVRICKDTEVNGIRVQICAYTMMRSDDGSRWSREYYEIRTQGDVVECGPRVRSVRAALAMTVDLYGGGDDLAKMA